MVVPVDASSRRSLALIRRIYLARIIVLSLGFICVGSALYELRVPAPFWWFAALYTLVWPHLAYLLEARSKQPHRTAMRTLLIDSVIVGFWPPVMHFNLLPSAAIAAMTSMSNVGIGGPRLLWRGVVAQAIGAGIGILCVGLHWQPVSTQLNILASLPLIILYPTAIGALTYQLSTRLSQQRNQLEHLSKHDGLSGLLNRMHWEALLADEFARSLRHCTPAAVILVDIDFFKAINDRGGHAAGDEVIRHFAGLLRANLREIDRVARYGGEEFAILQPGTTAVAAIETAERLRAILEREPLAGMPVTASFGVAELRSGLGDPGSWVRCADLALYRAKAEGRNRVVVYSPMGRLDHTLHSEIASRGCAQ